MHTLVIKNRKNKELIVKHWACANAQAILVIAHGAAEHINRYEGLAEYLSRHGIEVYGYDHEGHGVNKDSNQEYVYIDRKHGSEILVDDLEDVMTFAYEHSQRIPIYLLGHSMGSLIVRVLMARTHVAVSGVILSGSMNPSYLLKQGGLLLSSSMKKIQGKRKVNGLLNHMAFGVLHERISYNQDNIKNYIHDKNCGLPFSNASIYDLLKLVKLAGDKEVIANMQKTNYLILAGQDDVFSEKTKQLKALVKEFEKNHLKVAYKFYHGMKHEILQEDDKETVYQDIKDFVLN